MKEKLEILLSGKPVLPGTLEKRYNVCGKAGCCCKDKDNPRKHGPYYRLCYNLKGKNSSIFIPEQDALAIMEMTNNYRNARSNIQDLGLEMLELYHQNGLEGMLNKYHSMVDRVICKKSGGKPESGVLRDLRISRDKWKNKALERKTVQDKNRIKIRDLSVSRDNWKNKAMTTQDREKALQTELADAKKLLKRSIAETEETKKKTLSMENVLIDSSPCRFQFPLKTITMAIRLVVFALLSLRGAARCFRLFEKWFQGGLPCHVVIQNWILRFGLYKLRQAVQKRNDWVYILDHTIEFGTKKCLVVLGITLERFRANKCIICHQDMEVLAIDITEKANSASVTNTLCRVAENAGNPAQILSDGGNAIIGGARDFIKKAKSADSNYKVIHSYDVTHKTALILEHHLKDDEHWKKFVRFVSETKRCLLHTVLSYIAPPKPKDKARWANFDIYLKWAEMVLCWGKRGHQKAEQDKFNDKLSWLQEFKLHIAEWRTMLDILEALKKEVKNNGLNEKTRRAFEQATAKFQLHTPRLVAIKNEAIAYINKECAGLSDIYPGCSDIIESVFGKYKIFSGRSPMKEVGKMVLTIPAFTGNIDYAEVKAAMENVSAADVKKWLGENIGVSLFTKRKQAFLHKKNKKTGE